jgi:flavin-dependent dehydrogenase
MPAAVAALGRLGVPVTGRPFVGIRYLAPGRSVAAEFRAGPGLGVRRTTLHAALAMRAEQVGVDRVCGSVRTVEQDGDGVTAAGLRAGWLVAADGLHSPVRRSLGLQVDPTPGRPARYGLRRHFLVAPWSRHVEVYWGEHAEAYVTPVGDGLVGVAVLGPGGTPYEEALAGFPALLARLRVAEPANAVLGAGPLRQSARSPVSGRVLLAGDAAGYVDALTGRGRGGRAGHGCSGGGSGRCRAPAGLPVGLAAGDPALPVVGDRPAGRDSPPGPAPRPGPAGLGRTRRLRTGHRPGDLTRDDGSVGNYRATVGVS